MESIEMPSVYTTNGAGDPLIKSTTTSTEQTSVCTENCTEGSLSVCPNASTENPTGSTTNCPGDPVSECPNASPEIPPGHVTPCPESSIVDETPQINKLDGKELDEDVNQNDLHELPEESHFLENANATQLGVMPPETNPIDDKSEPVLKPGMEKDCIDNDNLNSATVNPSSETEMAHVTDSSYGAISPSTSDKPEAPETEALLVESSSGTSASTSTTEDSTEEKVVKSNEFSFLSSFIPKSCRVDLASTLTNGESEMKHRYKRKASYAEIKLARKNLLKIEKLADSASRSRALMRKRELSPPSSSDEENFHIGWIAYSSSKDSLQRQRYISDLDRRKVWTKVAKFVCAPVVKLCKKCSRRQVVPNARQ